MIHLFYGDSARESFRCFNKGGKDIVFREALLTGPAGLPGEDFTSMRAQHLANAYGASYEECLADLTAFEDALANVPDDEELVLWFGRDLFCQIALAYVLVRVGELRTKAISLVSPKATEEDVFCFGDIAPAEMNDYLQARVPVSALELQQAAIAWQLYASDDPEALNGVFDGSFEVGARFATALEAHAARFPSVRDALGETERALLLAAREETSFSELFREVSKRTRHITWGDAQIRAVCARLSTSSPPLMRILDAEDERAARYATTAEGLALLSGTPLTARWPSYWLGGCQISGAPTWFWDSEARRVVAG